MFSKILGMFIFCIAAGVAYKTYEQLSSEAEWTSASPSRRVSILIEEDFLNLSKNKELPPEWFYMDEVIYKMNSPVVNALMAGERPNLKKGLPTRFEEKDKNNINNYEAEIEVIDLPDENMPGFIFQISLLDKKSKNKVFEIGRSYYFRDLNKKKPD